MPTETELVVVQIEDVDMGLRRALATTNQEGLLNVYFRESPGGMLLIPKQGDLWLVVRRGWDWYLEKKLDSVEEHEAMLDKMGQGDMRFKAAGTILAEGEAMFLNGRPWGSTIRDSFHSDSGFPFVILTHDAIESQTIQPQLNGVLVPTSMWTYWPDTRTIEFLETIGEAGFLTVDYQTWMVNNDDAGTVGGRAVVRGLEAMTGPLDWEGRVDQTIIAAITAEGSTVAATGATSEITVASSASGNVNVVFFGAGAVVETTTEGATLTPTLPASTQANDIAFVLSSSGVQSMAPTGPSGYTPIELFRSSSMGYHLWWKRLAGSDADPTVVDNGPGETAISGSNGFWARTFIYRNCVTSGTPFEDATVANGNSTTPQTAAIDTVGSNRRAVNFLVIDFDTAWDSGHPPSGWADELTDYTTTFASNTRQCVIAKQIDAAGSVGVETVGTLAASMAWHGVTLALIPA